MKTILIIDIQNGLTKKKALYNELCFIENVNSAIKKYHESEFDVIFIQHNNKQLIQGTPDWEIDNRLYFKKEDVKLQKRHGNAFQNTDLKTILDNKEIKEVTVCGLVSTVVLKLLA